jgi:hypothetical protein
MTPDSRMQEIHSILVGVHTVLPCKPNAPNSTQILLLPFHLNAHQLARRSNILNIFPRNSMGHQLAVIRGLAPRQCPCRPIHYPLLPLHNHQITLPRAPMS